MSKKKKIESLIYCGPSFPGQVQQFSVFKGGIPEYLSNHLEKSPSFKSLFVPISEFRKVKERLNKKGSRENQLYQNVLKYQKGREV